MSTADPPTVGTLIDEALSYAPDSDERRDAVMALHFRGDQETFDAACRLLDSPEPARRELGVDVLAQLGVRPWTPGSEADERPYRQPAVELFVDLLGREREPTVLQAIASGFGHLDDARAIAPLARLAEHESEDVRYGVVFGLLGHDDDLAVDTLVALSRDPDSDVRDWATFGLGSQIDRDTPQVREALAARLDDRDGDTRDEAIAGLAARGDERAVTPLLALLDDGWHGPLLDQALVDLGARFDDPRLIAHLAARTTD